MTDHDEILERIAATLREPVSIDDGVDRRVMAEIATLPPPRRAESWWGWLWRPRAVQVRPIGGLAMALGLAVVVAIAGQIVRPAPEEVRTTASASSPTLVHFVLVAPNASTVALVGDFNDWNVAATPLAREAGDGVWSVTVPLSAGRYQYSYLVDGRTWLKDPAAASALEDEFGRPSSVVTIGGA